MFTRKALMRYQRDLRATGRLHHHHTRKVLTYQLGLWAGDVSTVMYRTDF